MAGALLATPVAAQAAGPWVQAGPTGFPPMTAVAADSDNVYGLAADGDVWRSAAGGAWTRQSRRPRRATEALAVAGGAIYVESTAPNILSRSTDGGATFDRCAPDGLGTADPHVVAAAGGRVAVIRGRRLALSRDGCRTWIRPVILGGVRTVTRSASTWLIVTERRSQPRGKRFRLLASIDGGATWKVRATAAAMTLASSPRVTRASLVADRVNPSRVWLVHEGKLTRSDDRGRTWSDATPAGFIVDLVVPDAKRTRVVHVMAIGTSTRKPIVRTSTNAGASWTDTAIPDTGALRTAPHLFAASTSRLAVAASGIWTYVL